MKASSSLKYLFISATRLKLIKIFFGSPKEIFYVRQLVRLTDEEINSVRRELENLKKADIIQNEWRGNRLYYWANPSSPLFVDLVTLAAKNSNFIERLQDKKSVGNIKLLLCSYKFLTNSENTNNSIDMILVGDVSIREVDLAVKEEESLRSREINYMVMDQNELKLRKQKRDPFIIDFFLATPLVVIGDLREL